MDTRRIATYSSPLGEIVIVTEGKFLIGLYFAGQRHMPADLGNTLEHAENTEKLLSKFDPCKMTKNWLDEYFAGSMPEHAPAIKFYGTDFQKRVWQELTRIPYGETRHDA